MKVNNNVLDILNDNNISIKKTNELNNFASNDNNLSISDDDIVKFLKDNNQEITQKNIDSIRKFLETNGDLENKLRAISLATSKEIGLNNESLTAIYQAVFKNIKFSACSLVNCDFLFDKEYDYKEDNELKSFDNSNNYKSKNINDDIKSSIKIKTETIKKTPFSLKNKGIVKEVREKINTEIKNSNNFINELDDDEMEMIISSLKSLEENIMEVFESISFNDVLEENIFFEDKRDVKKFLQLNITENYVKAKESFDYDKKLVDELLNIKDNNNIKANVSKAIDKLDNIIMKSDILLYTDIKSEKNLLVLSSELEYAKELADKDIKGAYEIVKNVRDELNKIILKPSKYKMFFEVNKLLFDSLYENKITKTVPIFEREFSKSSRGVLESFRDNGLNNENELSEKFFKKDLKSPINIKNILMNLSKEFNNKEEVLNHITGQQLLNKLDVKYDKQSLFFNFNVTIDNKVQNVKVHINANKNNQKVDYKNARLYFVIDNDRIGSVGVLLDIVNGYISILIKSDYENFYEESKEYFDILKERLKDIRLSVKSIRCEKFTKEEDEQVKSI